MDYRKATPLLILEGMSLRDSYQVKVADIEQSLCVMISISGHAGRAILAAINDDSPAATTYDTLTSVLDAFELTLREVHIDSLTDGLFQSSLLVSDGFNEKSIACPVSDAMVLCCTTMCPLMIANGIFIDAGFPLDQETRESLAPAQPAAKEATIEELQQQLDDYLAQEEYEKAAAIQALIEERTNRDNQ